MMGGGFGARQQLHHQPICAYLSKVVKRPVKMIYDREEEMYASTTRHGALINLKIGVNKDREMTTFYARVYLNTGAYSTLGPVVLSSMNRKMQYRVKNYRFEDMPFILTRRWPGPCVDTEIRSLTTHVRL